MTKARGWTDAVWARYQWIMQQVEQRGPLNVLDDKFVDAYIREFSPPYRVKMFGANSCRQLGRDLSAMYRSALLDRSRIGLIGAEPGFPKWVWVYQLRPDRGGERE